MKLDFDAMEETAIPRFRDGEKTTYARMFVDGNNRIMRGRLEPGASIGLHPHQGSSEIVYVLSGTGHLYANDSKGQTREYQIRSGQGFMIFPRQVNTYIADSDLPWEYTWIEFDGLRAKELIEIIVTDFEEGQVLTGKVVSIKEFGAFLEFAPGKEGMVHISKIAKERINRVEDVLTLGDVVKVVCLGKDKMGRVSFSIKDCKQ